MSDPENARHGDDVLASIRKLVGGGGRDETAREETDRLVLTPKHRMDDAESDDAPSEPLVLREAASPPSSGASETSRDPSDPSGAENAEPRPPSELDDRIARLEAVLRSQETGRAPRDSEEAPDRDPAPAWAETHDSQSSPDGETQMEAVDGDVLDAERASDFHTADFGREPDPARPPLDEAALRELVAEIVREELQGALGERITRNIRKLVRREIARSQVLKDLE